METTRHKGRGEERGNKSLKRTCPKCGSYTFEAGETERCFVCDWFEHLDMKGGE